MPKKTSNIQLQKCPMGITGLDQITGGGIPVGRTTLVCGGAGCGKTLLGIEFLVRGILDYDEPGVFISFEENELELTQNVASFKWLLGDYIKKKKLAIDFVYIERSEIEETGEYDLEGLFVRLESAIDSVKAKRVVLDTMESLFSGLPNTGILRAELRRLFRWLKKKGVTAIITGEVGEGSLTRYGFEEYVSDCVLELSHLVSNQVATRRLRIVKYRGSSHGTNEYPFLIDETGISVVPVNYLDLKHGVSKERISSGIPRLDAMLGGRGFYRGSSVLVSGTPGTGKSSLAASFVSKACGRGERCLYFAFEESPNQIVRNMKSIGLDLGKYLKKGNLKINAARPTSYGLEMHLASIYNQINDFNPDIVVIDPISNLGEVGTQSEVSSILTRMVDYMKSRKITALFTNLINAGSAEEATDIGISSLMDTWLFLRDIEIGGERNRGMFILKSRGMAHSNQIREFVISDRGIDLVNVYTGPEGVLTGTARYMQEARMTAEADKRRGQIRSKKYELERKRKVMESQIEALKLDFQLVEQELQSVIDEEMEHTEINRKDRKEMARLRKADA